VFAQNLQAAGTSGIFVKAKKNSAVIVSGDQPLLYVTTGEAKAHGVNAGNLARQWVSTLRKAGALPPVKLSEDGFKLPLGQARRVSMVGSAVSDVVISSTNEDVVTATREGNQIVVRCVGLGQAYVAATAADGEAKLAIKVMPFAANFPQAVSATVTGNPVPAETIKSVIDGVLTTQFKAQTGAKWVYDLPKLNTLEAGETKSFSVNVRASANNAFESTGKVNVVVRNVALPFIRESELWYCNHPETVVRPQNLFAAVLRSGQPTRMLYHHINQSGSGLYFTVQVVNGSEKPARIIVIPGDSKPDKNPVLAGYIAGDQFVRGWIRNAGEVVEIPPGSVMPLSVRRAGPMDTVSGLCYLRLLDGGPSGLLVRTDAVSPTSFDPLWNRGLDSSTPWREIAQVRASDLLQTFGELSPHVYPDPFKNEEVTYRVGENFGFVRIGQKPIASESGQRLDGNFGVIYTIKATIENPTLESKNVDIIFEASAGYTGALFMINGEYLKTPLLQPKGESRLVRVRVAPGEKKSYTIQTIPLSGASYPATLAIRTAEGMAGFGGGK
jgi:hypothetical protein